MPSDINQSAEETTDILEPRMLIACTFWLPQLIAIPWCMQAAAARVTNLFAEELPSEKRMYATRASQPVARDRTLFGNPTQQPGLERLVMKKPDLRNKQAMRGLAVELLWQEDGQWWPATITQAHCLPCYDTTQD